MRRVRPKRQLNRQQTYYFFSKYNFKYLLALFPSNLLINFIATYNFIVLAIKFSSFHESMTWPYSVFYYKDLHFLFTSNFLFFMHKNLYFFINICYSIKWKINIGDIWRLFKLQKILVRNNWSYSYSVTSHINTIFIVIDIRISTERKYVDDLYVICLYCLWIIKTRQSFSPSKRNSNM